MLFQSCLPWALRHPPTKLGEVKQRGYPECHAMVGMGHVGGEQAEGGSGEEWVELAGPQTEPGKGERRRLVEVWAEEVQHGCWVWVVAGEEHCGSLQTRKNKILKYFQTKNNITSTFLNNI